MGRRDSARMERRRGLSSADRWADAAARATMMAAAREPKPSGLLPRMRRRRKPDELTDYKALLLQWSRFDSYKLNREDSQLHWDTMTLRTHRLLPTLRCKKYHYTYYPL